MQRIYFGGNIITMESGGAIPEAVLTQDGVIKAVGSLEDIKAELDVAAEYFDLAGKTLLPAFIDAHSHLTMQALNMQKADLSSAESFDDIVRILTKFREENKLVHGEYIQGYGYDHNRLKEGMHSDKLLLDNVSLSNPIFITHASMHMGVANSMALKLAGLSKESELSEELAGRFADGELNGFLAETGMTNVFLQIQNLPVDLELLYQKAQNEYAKYGICTVQDGALGKDQFLLLKEIADKGIFNMDVAAYLMAPDSAHEILADNENMRKHYTNHLKISGYKLVLDGSPQGKTAWLSEPYTDGTNGVEWLSDEQVEYFVSQAVQDGVQILVHCNGDCASEQFLSAYEKVDHPRKKSLRPVMIHSQTVRRDQLERFSEIGMMPSFFITHIYYWGDIHLVNLGEERAANISPAGWAQELGLVYTFHQDTPVVPPDMLKTIQTAVERKTEKGILLGDNQRINVYQALEAVTINAAYQYGEEDTKGSIKAGKYADFVILEKDPLAAAIHEISKINVCQTIFRDKSIYLRKEVENYGKNI